MADDFEFLEQEIKAVLEKYSKMSAIVIIRNDDTNDIVFAGNMCPVCAATDLTLAIITNNLQHNEQTDGKVH